MRRLELLLMVITLFIQAMLLGIIKSVNLNECGYIGELRNFIITFVPNAFLLFWALSMGMNFWTTQHASKDLTRINTQQRYIYIVLAIANIFFICFNCLATKYNYDVWCRDSDNYELAAL